MNRSKKSKSKYLKVHDDRDGQFKIQETSPLPPRKTKVQIGTNGESHNGHDVRMFDHSTPVRKKNYTNDVDGSPEIDYRYSPIMIPLTQDSNEVAWDWQSSSKTTKKDTCGSNFASTPKRTKHLQKKRNSDSPLLYKPHKRKLVKLENIESIGIFAAELQAITEQMNSMKRSDEKCMNKPVTCNNQTNNALFIQDAIEMKGAASPKNQTHKDTGSTSKINTSFDDLFDDTINDSMIRCSQEIEAKFNDENKKNGNVVKLSTVCEEAELLVRLDEDNHLITAGNSSSDNSKVSHGSENSLTFAKIDNSKSYSKSSSSTEWNSARQTTKSNMNINKQSCFNNNIHHSHSSLQSSSTEMFEIPDDSFDDCLATCMESDEILSNSIEDNIAFVEANQKMKYSEKSYKNTSSLQTKSIIAGSALKFSDTCNISKHNYYGNNTKAKSNNGCNKSRNDRIGKVANGKNIAKETGSFSGFKEERKFFKTKSLSDSYFDHGEKRVVYNKVNAKISSDHAFRSSSTLNSESNKSENINGSINNRFGNAQFPQGVDASNDEKLPSVDSTHNACMLDFNRSAKQGNGNPITRHHSLSSLHVHTKDTSRGIQGTLCTPAEIEKKRLEAKMRLEAKRKQQMCANSVNLTGNFVRGSVKR